MATDLKTRSKDSAKDDGGETPWPPDGMSDEEARRADRDKSDEAAVGAGRPEIDAAKDEITGGRSVAERAQDPVGEDDSDPEPPLFVLEQGRRVTLTTLFKRSTPVEYAINLGSKAVKGSGDMGLVGFADPDILLVVPARAGKVVIDPTYDGDGMISKVTIRATLKPTTCYDAQSAAGRAVLGLGEE